MTDYPTVGLKVDLTGIEQGEKAYDRLKGKIEGVGNAVAAASTKITSANQKVKTSNAGVAASNDGRAKSADKAGQTEERAAKRTAREQERLRKYLLQVRLNSIKMEDTARKASEAAEAAASAAVIQRAQKMGKAVEDAMRKAAKASQDASREQVKAADKAAKDVEAIERGILAFRIRMRGQEFRQSVKLDADTLAFKQRMWAQQIREMKATYEADKKASDTAAAKAEQNRKYLTGVRIRSAEMESAAAAKAAKDRADADKKTADQVERHRMCLLSVRLKSIQMEDAAQRQADADELRRARALASISRGGGGGIRTGGGGGSSGVPGPGDLSLINGVQTALARLRGGLADTRRLFFDLRTAIGVFLGAMIVRPIFDMADAMTALKARIAAFTTSSTDVPYLMEAVFQAAQRSRAPLESIATLYTRLAPLAKQLGKSQMELLRISETVAKGFQIGGATPEESKAASQQLAQALASNRLGGDELRSLAENAPILMAKIAQALNMNTGQFIKWAHEGKATAEVVVGALEKAQADIDRIFNAFPVTIAQGVTLVRNSLANMIGKVNEATGASVAIASSIANFSSFLDSAKTVETLTKAIEGLGAGMNFLGDAMRFVGSMWPVIATVLAGMAAARLMAIVSGWMALQKALGMFAVVAQGVGRAQATLIVGQSALAASAAAAGRAFSSLLAVVGGPLGAAVIALATAFTFMKKAQDDAASAADRYKSSQEGGLNALERASAFALAYGVNTDGLTRAMNSATGASNGAAASHDTAMKAAMARAEAERMLTVRLLEREAAEAGKEARTSLKSITGVAGLGTQRRINEANLMNPLLTKDQRNAFKLANAEIDVKTLQAGASAAEGIALQRNLQKQADDLRKAKLTITIPDKAGPAAAAAKKDEKPKRNPFEGALDGVQKLQAAINGLKAEINSISANPLDALSAQIVSAGNEAAAALEAGDKQNAVLADKTRSLAMEKEQLTITKQMIQESANNTRQINMEADANSALATAQIKSTQIMEDFWTSGGRTLEGYTAALGRSRQVTADAEAAASELSIAQRFGAQSLGEIAKAYVAAGLGSEEYGMKVQAAAVVEAAAAAASIRRKAALDALANQSQDVRAFDASNFQDAQETLQHMVTLSDNLGDSLAAAFGRGGAALGRMMQVMNSYSAKQLEVRKRVTDVMKVEDGRLIHTARSLEIERQGNEELTQARLQGYAEMASAAKTFFKEGSDGYKIMQAAETAFRVYEFAMTAKSIAIKAAETAAKIGFFGAQAQAAATAGAANMFATLGPAGFAAVAAMVAVLGGLGLALGGGGGGAPKASNMETRQTAQGAGSVLGDASAKSESISRALEIVASNTNENLEYSNDMLAALRSIDSNIGALTSSLARQLGVGGFLSGGAPGLGTTRKGPSDLASLAVGGPVGLLLTKLPVIGGIINSLFGTKKTTSLQDAGISFGSGSLADILNQGVSGQTYQDIATQTKKKAFGITYSNKTKTSTTTADLDANIADEITRVIESLRTGVLSAATALGVTGAQAAIDAMTINLGKLSFKDMSGEEIEAALQAVFSKLGDDMATLALPVIESLQQAGEGAFETLIRVARNYQVLDVSLAQIGLTFGAVGVSSLKARQRLIDLAGGIDELASQTAYYAENFLSDQERIGPVIKAVYTELGKLGFGSIKTKDEFTALVNSLDLTTEAGAAAFATLMRVAPGFAQIVEYTEALTAANDNVSEAQGRLNDLYDTAAGLIGDTRDRFADFVETFKAFRQELETGPLAANSPQDQYLKSKALFESTRTAALGGDEQALANLQSVSQAYLDASRDYYASTEPYFQDLAAVKAAIDQAQVYAQTQVDKADQQLAALNQMVAGYVTINTSVLTVAQAVNNVQAAVLSLKDAMASQAAAIAAAAAAAAAAANAGAGAQTAQVSAGLDVARYLAANPDLAQNYLSGGILAQSGLSLEDAARLHYQNTGQAEIAAGTRSQYGEIPVTTNPEPAAPAAPANDLQALTGAVAQMTNVLRENNVLTQAGAQQTLEKLDALIDEQADTKAATRRSQADAA